MSGGYCIMSEQELVLIEIDLNAKANGKLDESFLGMFGSAVETIMQRMFGGGSVPVKVKGTPTQVRSFEQAMKGEKKYVETAAKYGLDDPRTYKNKYKLKKATAGFERNTGIKWPFSG